MHTTDAATVSDARASRDAIAALLREHAVPGAVELTGGSSIVGLVTKGDIDLHLRVESADFGTAVERLGDLAEAVHPEIWTASFATFERTVEPVVGIAVTVVGTEHDTRFALSWQRMRADAALRAQYNAVKRQADHEAAKSAFFDRISAPHDPAADPAAPDTRGTSVTGP